MSRVNLYYGWYVVKEIDGVEHSTNYMSKENAEKWVGENGMLRYDRDFDIEEP